MMVKGPMRTKEYQAARQIEGSWRVIYANVVQTVFIQYNVSLVRFPLIACIPSLPAL
jgi:hypothetical protein